jgi:zinc protease
MEQTIIDKTTEHVFGNGLKLIFCRKTTAPVVSTQVWYKTGSVRENAGIRGISHIIEHLMFRGSAHVASEQHSRRINDVGGHCNAFTSEDVSAYINSVPRDYMDMVLELEADRMAGLTLDKDILETERKVIIEEYHTYMNNPVAKAFLEFRKSFYGNHPYATGPLGNLEDINAISRDNCEKYFRQYYVPSNAVIVIVGDITEKAAIESVERHFAGLRAPDSRRDSGGCDNLDADCNSGWMKRVVEFDVPMIIAGFPAPASSSRDALPLDILQMIVSQGESSRLHREVVRRQSLAVMAGGMNHFLRLSGMSLFFAAFTPDCQPEKVLEAIEHQIKLVLRDGITGREMEKIRTTMLASRAFEMYSADHICQRLGYAETVEGSFKVWIKRISALRDLKREELLEAAKKYWSPQKRYSLYLKPKKIKPILFIAGLARRMFMRRA